MEITSLITSAKAAYNIAKGIASLKSEVERNESISKIIEALLSVQSEALEMQAKLQELLRESDELRRTLLEFEKWSETESQYELKEVSSGIFVYAYKKPGDSAKPMHWLCTNCYKDRKASILQLARQDIEERDYFCPNCRTEIIISNTSTSSSPPFNGDKGGPNNWLNY